MREFEGALWHLRRALRAEYRQALNGHGRDLVPAAYAAIKACRHPRDRKRVARLLLGPAATGEETLRQMLCPPSGLKLPAALRGSDLYGLERRLGLEPNTL